MEGTVGGSMWNVQPMEVTMHCSRGKGASGWNVVEVSRLVRPPSCGMEGTASVSRWRASCTHASRPVYLARLTGR